MNDKSMQYEEKAEAILREEGIQLGKQRVEHLKNLMDVLGVSPDKKFIKDLYCCQTGIRGCCPFAEEKNCHQYLAQLAFYFIQQQQGYIEKLEVLTDVQRAEIERLQEKSTAYNRNRERSTE